MSESYRKIDSPLFYGSQINNFNGRSYNILEIYGENEALLQDTKKQEFVLAHGLQKYMKVVDGKLPEIGYSWDRGEYYDSLSSINFQKLNERNNDITLAGMEMTDKSLTLFYDSYNNRLSIEDEENHRYQDYDAYTPSDISSALSSFVKENYSETNNIILGVVKECVEDLERESELKPLIPYHVLWGSGTYEMNSMAVYLEEKTTDYGAILDMVVDKLQEEGRTDCFISFEDTKEGGGDIFEDEYVIAGNNGLYLYHYGQLDIKEFPPLEFTYNVFFEDTRAPWNGEQTVSFNSYSDLLDYLKGESVKDSFGNWTQLKPSELPFKIETTDGRILFEGENRVDELGRVVSKDFLEKNKREQPQEKQDKNQNEHKHEDKPKKRDDESR